MVTTRKTLAAKNPNHSKDAVVLGELAAKKMTRGDATGLSSDLVKAPLLFLDTNVLLPQYVRSIFFDLADAGACRVHWSDQILIEWRRNIVAEPFLVPTDKALRLARQMQVAFPDAAVQSWEALETHFDGLVHTADRHVAAGALRLSRDHPGSEVILVTHNVKHLPQRAFDRTRVRSARPGQVLAELLRMHAELPGVMDAMLARFVVRPMTRRDLLAVLDASGCAVFATGLGKAWGLAYR